MFDNKEDMAKIKYKVIDPEVDILKLGCFTIEFVMKYSIGDNPSL
jgi:hypothetical protein